MKKIIIIFAFLFLFASPADAQENSAGASAMPKNRLIKKDERVEKLEVFLEKYNSPLSEYASVFVENADKYSLDFRLVAAITGVESTFGKRIPFESYNAYGWSNGAYRFSSWEDSINHVSKFLKEKYIDRGLDSVDKIAPVYAPPSSTWGGKVTFFMNKIENFSERNSLETLDLTI
ncbi:MAG: hypothetical protein ABIH88_03300 [Patescibacteria group bacterium]|nr:glucosaminidase domain-containing protein [Patescibacteria group bacterium]